MNLSKEALKAKAAYQKAWAAKNRDKTRKYIANYWERQASKAVTDIDTDNLSVSTCLQCGNKFSPKRNDAKFCSDLCRVKYNRNKGNNARSKAFI